MSRTEGRCARRAVTAARSNSCSWRSSLMRATPPSGGVPGEAMSFGELVVRGVSSGPGALERASSCQWIDPLRFGASAASWSGGSGGARNRTEASIGLVGGVVRSRSFGSGPGRLPRVAGCVCPRARLVVPFRSISIRPARGRRGGVVVICSFPDGELTEGCVDGSQSPSSRSKCSGAGGAPPSVGGASGSGSASGSALPRYQVPWPPPFHLPLRSVGPLA